MKTILYQKDYQGLKLKIWTIRVENDAENAAFPRIITTSQLGENGKISEDSSIVKIAKQGYKNLWEQAEFEAQSKINLKERQGWTKIKENAQPDYILGSGSYRPMLAHPLDPFKKIGGSKDLKGWGIEGKNVIIQPKLDGNRLLVHINANNGGSGVLTISMFSREGEYMNFSHIREDILKVINRNFTHFFGEDFWLDGEIYSHKEDFDFINGTYRKFKEVDIEQQKKLEYHIYDAFNPNLLEDYIIREQKYIAPLFNFPTNSLRRVEGKLLNANQELLDKHLEEFVSKGYEGIMVRKINMPYEFKRTSQLLKYKPERKEDKEFECIGVNESAYGNMVGSMIFKLDNGETFKGTPNVPQERCIEWWENKDQIIGKKFTVVFNGYTQYGKPRFPRVKAIRED